MTAAESLLYSSYLLILFGALGFGATLANAITEWLYRRTP
jgi:hypothetical protein